MSYDADLHILRIRFVSGLIYNYKGVPEEIFRALKTAASKGTFLNQYIKGKYEFEKNNELR